MTDDPTPHTEPTSTDSPSRLIWYKDWILLTTLPTVLVLDQLSKWLVKSNFHLGQSWPQEGLLRITYATNSGTAFGLLRNQTVFLIVASFIAVGFLVYFYRTHAIVRPVLRLSIGLQLGGAFGNLLDRLTAGVVVDFIDVGWWPIFNLADSSIVVGITILVVTLLFFDKSPPEQEASGAGEQERSTAGSP
ncbi:MAG: signal peptidase II [Chloroflexi bacterium]|nr:signal peptidase II [Chloroflexota bacterium]MCH8870387.1 signal peptidase II [Chloroflexota bacterium]MCH9040333.1 signal peptidase II [Chloroflexota bacterium]MCI0791355.1 signal peptidase II [Chloroflexota bacterium]MCI0796684.1 signal peptidase II [Chloroflexota bacterium]